MCESKWTKEEKKKLNGISFSPYYGDETDYRREVSYGDVVYDTVSKNSHKSYSAIKHNKEGYELDYVWVSESEEFNNFDALISFLNVN